MKFFELVNLGGPINWFLFVMLCWCLLQCFEKCFYFHQTFQFKNNNKSYKARLENKFESIKFLSKEEIKKELEKESTLIYHEMNRGLWFLNFISAVAPSIGLLGTVVGLISAFQGMENAGAQVNMQDLSGGIWVAMLTTAFGMMISIPSLFFYRTFKRIIEKRMMNISLFISEKC